MITALCLYLLVQFLAAQFSGKCEWGDFSLKGAQGYEIQCIDEQYAYGYTPCMSYALCQGQRYQATYFNRNNGQCSYYLAEWDDGETAPQYANVEGIGQWTFHYDNGESLEECPGGKIQFHITWICDPNAQPFSLQTTCGKVSDCDHNMQIRSVYACVVPPENSCKWDDFSLQQVMGYNIVCNDNDFTYEYTPCIESALCDGITYQATYFNRISGECQYYLSQWDYGSTQPVYFNNGGNPVWQFNYKNGQETQQCPHAVQFTVNWVCNANCTPYCLDTQCNQINECSHQITVNSSYACVIGDKSKKTNKTKIIKLLEMQKKLILSNK